MANEAVLPAPRIVRALRTTRAVALTAVCVVALPLQGCSVRQGYSAAQAMRQQACNRLPDKQESDRCLAQAGGSYEDYDRARASVR